MAKKVVLKNSDTGSLYASETRVLGCREAQKRKWLAILLGTVSTVATLSAIFIPDVYVEGKRWVGGVVVAVWALLMVVGYVVCRWDVIRWLPDEDPVAQCVKPAHETHCGKSGCGSIIAKDEIEILKRYVGATGTYIRRLLKNCSSHVREHMIVATVHELNKDQQLERVTKANGSLVEWIRVARNYLGTIHPEHGSTISKKLEEVEEKSRKFVECVRKGEDLVPHGNHELTRSQWVNRMAEDIDDCLGHNESVCLKHGVRMVGGAKNGV